MSVSLISRVRIAFGVINSLNVRMFTSLQVSMFRSFSNLKSYTMATIKKFEDILSLQKARELNKIIGRIIDSGKFKRSYRLINQIEGSAGSIIDNIAEGFERSGNKEFLQFIYISKGSCGEFRSQLYRV